MNKNLYRVKNYLFFNNPIAEDNGNQIPDVNNPNANIPPPNPNPPTSIDVTPLIHTIGQQIGDGQCYALAKWWVSQLGGNGALMVGYMNASDIWTDYSWGTGSFTGFTSGSGVPSDGWQLGDIVCFGASGGNPYGHVGIVAEIDNSAVYIINQNVSPYFLSSWLYTDASGNVDKLDITTVNLSAYWIGGVTGYVRKTT